MAIIRARLYQLEVAHPVAKSSDRISYFDRNGFCVFRCNDCLDSLPEQMQLVQNLKAEFENTYFQIIFNNGRVRSNANRAMAERRQLMTKILENDRRDDYFDEPFCDFLSRTEVRVLQHARNMLPQEHGLVTTETILSSKANSRTIQDPHCDLSDRYVGKALLAFVAIQPNTTIIIYPGSHRIHEGLQEDYPPQRYALNVGDILIFHPRLIHCGDRYSDSNIRLHYYIFAVPRLRWRNITFPVRDGELALMRITRDRLQRRENRLIGADNRRAAEQRRVDNFLRLVRPYRPYGDRR